MTNTENSEKKTLVPALNRTKKTRLVFSNTTVSSKLFNI